MSGKKALRRRIAELEAARHAGDFPLNFDVLTICFTDKTVEWAGRTVTVDANCVSIPFPSRQPFYVPLRSRFDA